MASNSRKFQIEVLGDTSKAQKSLSELGDTANKHLSGLAGMAKMAAGAFASKELIDGVGNLISAARESEKVSKITEAAIKSTGGAANLTAKQIGDLATAISNKTGVDDEQIQTSQNLLLRFTALHDEVGKGNQIFSRASQAMVDMGTVLGSSDAAAMKLGKALEDPVKGVTSLARAGVDFSAQQKDMVKAMVATGDTLGAQKVILDQVEQKYGGTAAAASTSADKMRVAWGNFQEDLGKKLLPLVDGFSTWMVQTGLPALEKFGAWVGEKVTPKLKEMGAWINDNVLPALRNIGAWITNNWPGITATFSRYVDAVGQSLSGLIKFGEGVITFFQGVFQGDWSKAWDGIKGIASGAWHTIAGLPAEVAKDVVSAIEKWGPGVAEKIVSIFKGIFIDLPVKLAGDLASSGAKLAGKLGAAIANPLIDAIEGAINTALSKIPDWVPGIGGRSVDLGGTKTTMGTGNGASIGGVKLSGGSTVKGGMRTAGVSSGSKGTKLDPASIYALAIQAGFSPADARTATAISLAESLGGYTGVQGDTKLANATWGNSIGLWQVRSLKAQTGTGKTRDASKLSDPSFNAAAAFKIFSDRGGTFQDWSTYIHGDYKGYLATVDAALKKGGSSPKVSVGLTSTGGKVSAGGFAYGGFTADDKKAFDAANKEAAKAAKAADAAQKKADAADAKHKAAMQKAADKAAADAKKAQEKADKLNTTSDKTKVNTEKTATSTDYAAKALAALRSDGMSEAEAAAAWRYAMMASQGDSKSAYQDIADKLGILNDTTEKSYASSGSSDDVFAQAVDDFRKAVDIFSGGGGSGGNVVVTVGGGSGGIVTVGPMGNPDGEDLPGHQTPIGGISIPDIPVLVGPGPSYGGGPDNGDGTGGTGRPGRGGAYATGGYFRPRPGGYWGKVAEGREPEVIAPEPVLRSIVRQESGGGSGVTVQIMGNVYSDRDLVRSITDALRSAGYVRNDGAVVLAR